MRLEQFKDFMVTDDKYRQLLDSSLDGMVLLSGTKIIYANASEAKLLDYDNASELIGLDISITLPEDEKEQIRQRTLSRQRGEPEPSRYELKLLRKDGKTVETETATAVIKHNGKTAVLAQTRDVTKTKRFERQVMALHAHAASLSHASNLEEVSQATLDAIELVIGFHIASFMIVEGDALRVHQSRGAPTLSRLIQIRGKGITAKAAREQRTVLVNDLRSDPDFLRGTADSLSELAVPVVLDGEVVVVLNLENVEVNAFDVVDQKLLETLSVHVSSARASAQHTVWTRYPRMNPRLPRPTLASESLLPVLLSMALPLKALMWVLSTAMTLPMMVPDSSSILVSPLKILR